MFRRSYVPFKNIARFVLSKFVNSNPEDAYISSYCAVPDMGLYGYTLIFQREHGATKVRDFNSERELIEYVERNANSINMDTVRFFARGYERKPEVRVVIGSVFSARTCDRSDRYANRYMEPDYSDDPDYP